VKHDGTLWVCGLNSEVQLGDNNNRKAIDSPVLGLLGVTEIAVANSHAAFVKSDGSACGFEDNSTGRLGRGEPCIVCSTTLCRARPKSIAPVSGAAPGVRNG